ncbi:MAG: LysR family transcriptional regulator [Chloroflexota bacterium]
MGLQRSASFLHAAKELSFSAAAKNLHVTQPTISHHIKMMENELKTELFDRSVPSLRVTEAGPALLPWTRTLIQDSRELREMAYSLQDGVADRLRMAGSTTAGEDILPQLAARFSKRHPGMHVSILACTPDRALPRVLEGEANLGVVSYEPQDDRPESQVFFEDSITLIVRAHPPWALRGVIEVEEMVVAAAQDPESIDYARSKGAAGINLCGICCTANEILMRQDVAVVGDFLSQELALFTGAVDAMVLDMQSIMQALGDLSAKFHTKLITTSPKAHITGATRVEFDEHRDPEIARGIVRMAIDNFPRRNGRGRIPQVTADLVPGFSHQYIDCMLGGSFRGSFRPLNDAVMAGRIRGAAAWAAFSMAARLPGCSTEPTDRY